MKAAVFFLVLIYYFVGVLMTEEASSDGSYTPADDDPELQRAMILIYDKQNEKFHDNAQYSLVRVVKAILKYSSGTYHEFELEVTGRSTNWICEVMMRYWNTSESRWSRVTCEESETVGKRDVAMPGGQVPVEDMNDEGVQGAIREIEKQRNMMCNCLFYQIVTDIGSATSQVVNGIIYRFNDVTFVSSTCTQGEGFEAADSGNLDSCKQREDAVPEVQPSIAVLWSSSDSQYSIMRQDN